MMTLVLTMPDRKNGINLIPSRYHWDQLDAKVIVLDINFPVRCLTKLSSFHFVSIQYREGSIGALFLE
jgi:hypothetical protein